MFQYNIVLCTKRRADGGDRTPESAERTSMCYTKSRVVFRRCVSCYFVFFYLLHVYYLPWSLSSVDRGSASCASLNAWCLRHARHQ